MWEACTFQVERSYTNCPNRNYRNFGPGSDLLKMHSIAGLLVEQ